MSDRITPARRRWLAASEAGDEAAMDAAAIEALDLLPSPARERHARARSTIEAALRGPQSDADCRIAIENLGPDLAEAFRAGVEAGPLPRETWANEDPAPREWIVPGLVPAGRLCALYGAGGTGKSLLALQLANAVMHGGPVLPIRGPNRKVLRDAHAALRDVPSTGSVLWLTWEDEVAEILRRWRALHEAGAITVPWPDPERLHVVDMRAVGGPLWGPTADHHVATVATWTDAGKRFVKQLAGHRLAIVDPLAAAYASSDLDRALVRRFTSAIDHAAQHSRCAVLLVAHPSLSGTREGGHAHSGSTDWQASVRAHLVLETSQDTGVAAPQPHDAKKGPNGASTLRLAAAQRQAELRARRHLRVARARRAGLVRDGHRNRSRAIRSCKDESTGTQHCGSKDR